MAKSKPSAKFSWHALSRRQFLVGASSLAVASTIPLSHAQSSSTLRTRSYADIRSLDPAFSQGVPDEEIQSLMYSKLIQYEPGSEWKTKLDAASELKQIDDTHINFALRDDVGFNNGFGPMTAEDVKYSFERIIDEKLESTNQPDMSALSHVEVTGERTGTIVLKNAFQPLGTIALPYITGNIVSKKAFESVGGKISTSAVAASGPYMFESWQPKQKTTLVKNPAWRGKAQGFDKIEFFPIDDEKAAEIAFEAGEIDFTRISLASLERLKADPPANSTIKEFPSLFYVWVGMNLEHPKLQSLELRQAIQYAIDVPSIMAASYFGVAQPSTGIIAPGLVGHRQSNLTGESADVEKAQKLLKQSGETNVKLSLTIINTQANLTTAQIIQANLATIGIDLEIKSEEGATFWASGDNDNLELVLNRYSMTPDPFYASSWFICEQAKIWNWERFCNPEFDKIHQDAQSEADSAKRNVMYQRAQDLMEQSGAYKFLTHEATPNINRNNLIAATRPDGLPLYRDFAQA